MAYKFAIICPFLCSVTTHSLLVARILYSFLCSEIAFSVNFRNTDHLCSFRNRLSSVFTNSRLGKQQEQPNTHLSNLFQSPPPVALQPFEYGLGLLYDRCPFFFVLHLFTPLLLRSASTTSNHLSLGLPLILFPPGLSSRIFLLPLFHSFS
jgi:hypothetical protein